METSSAYFRPAPAHSSLTSHPGLPLRIVSENKRICTRSRCSSSDTPQRVWVSRTKTCEPPSFQASMLRLPAPWTRFLLSPRSSITSATGNSKGTRRSAKRISLVAAEKAIVEDVAQLCQTEKSSELTVHLQSGSRRQTRQR